VPVTGGLGYMYIDDENLSEKAVYTSSRFTTDTCSGCTTTGLLII